MVCTVNWKLISQGAEAKVFDTYFCGRPCIVKERVKKSYRLTVLDKKLSHRRLVQEARCNMKCKKVGISTPAIYLIDEEEGRIFMEKVNGNSAKDFFNSCYDSQLGNYSANALEIAYKIGEAIGKMHDANIVHGDLTTSNIMVQSTAQNKVTVIDFGLSNSQPLPEDKAVDLYVMERAIFSTHIDSVPLVDEILRAYKAHSRHSDNMFQRLAQVRLRGRKRTMVG